MKNILLFLLVIFIIPFEKFFIPHFYHIFSFSLILFLNFFAPPSFVFPFSFLYAIALESFNPYKIWFFPFYFSFFAFAVVWFKKNINYHMLPVFFVFTFFLSLSFFLLFSPFSSIFLKSLFSSIVLTLIFKLWKKKRVVL